MCITENKLFYLGGSMQWMQRVRTYLELNVGQKNSRVTLHLLFWASMASN
jgi:hypothetical protein